MAEFINLIIGILIIAVILTVNFFLKRWKNRNRQLNKASSAKEVKQNSITEFQSHQNQHSLLTKSSINSIEKDSDPKKNPALGRIQKLSPFKKAIVWSEILGKPISERNDLDL